MFSWQERETTPKDNTTEDCRHLLQTEESVINLKLNQLIKYLHGFNAFTECLTRLKLRAEHKSDIYQIKHKVKKKSVLCSFGTGANNTVFMARKVFSV